MRGTHRATESVLFHLVLFFLRYIQNKVKKKGQVAKEISVKKLIDGSLKTSVC